MGPKPQGHRLFRLDVNADYSPSNCIWHSKGMIGENRQYKPQRRSQVELTYNGETKTLADWTAQTGLRLCVLLYRLKAGWSAEKTLTTPVKTRGIRSGK